MSQSVEVVALAARLPHNSDFEFIHPSLNFWKTFVMLGIFERGAGSKESERHLCKVGLTSRIAPVMNASLDRSYYTILEPLHVLKLKGIPFTFYSFEPASRRDVV